jgi:hypothetical protein
MFCCAYQLNAEDNNSAPAVSRDYEAILYELGAFPVNKLTKPYWNNGNPGKVYGKGERIDVNGWLSPYWAKSGEYLTNEEEVKYKIPKAPLTYEKYISFLDIEEYKKNHNPLLFAVMKFTIDCMVKYEVPLKDPEVIVKIYEAKVGLEWDALRILHGDLSNARLMELYKKHKDSELIDLFPTPKADDKKYVEFLDGLSSENGLPIYDRFRILGLLVQMDTSKYLVKERDFIISNVNLDNEGRHWWYRSKMYSELVKIADNESLDLLNSALLKDPITECRETILNDITKPELAARFIETALKLADGKGNEHNPAMMSRPPNGFEMELRRYFEWALKLENLDSDTKTKIKEALSKLSY